MSELTGLSADELEDLPTAWERIVPEEDQAALRGVDLTSGEVITTPAYRLVRPDGTTRWVESRVAPERDLDGQVVAVSGLTRDITARREGEVALRRTLEREQQAADRLRELAELKDSLLAAVSHELRTPLTAVLGFAEVLRSAGESMEPERRERALMALERNAQRLEQLLADLLDLDRLDRGVIEPARRAADVAAIVASVLDRIEPHPHTHVEAAVPSRIIEVDPAKIERVVENLVVNAMKHSGPRCHVWIRAHDVDGGLLLAVEDDGPGIPDESKTRVFEPFERGDSTSPVPGTGIGLSLVRRFVELHGGRVSVEDRTGGGATFTVWLPDPEPGDQQDGEDADGT